MGIMNEHDESDLPPQPIKGYRELGQEELDDINALKLLGEVIGRQLAALAQKPQTDKRWIAIAKTHMQQGCMAATRAVAKPKGFA